MEMKAPKDRSTVYEPDRGGYVFYFDDVDRILAVLSDIGEVTADTGGATGRPADASELDHAHVETASRLTLTATSARGDTVVAELVPALRITISNSQDSASRGAAERIVDAVHTARRRPLPAVLNARGGFLVLLATVVAAFALATAATSRLPSPWSGIAAFAGMMVAGGGLFYFRERARPCLFVQSYRADAPTLWERNRDGIILGLVINVATSLLFFWLGTLRK